MKFPQINSLYCKNKTRVGSDDRHQNAPENSKQISCSYQLKEKFETIVCFNSPDQGKPKTLFLQTALPS